MSAGPLAAGPPVTGAAEHPRVPQRASDAAGARGIDTRRRAAVLLRPRPTPGSATSRCTQRGHVVGREHRTCVDAHDERSRGRVHRRDSDPGLRSPHGFSTSTIVVHRTRRRGDLASRECWSAGAAITTSRGPLSHCAASDSTARAMRSKGSSHTVITALDPHRSSLATPADEVRVVRPGPVLPRYRQAPCGSRRRCRPSERLLAMRRCPRPGCTRTPSTPSLSCSGIPPIARRDRYGSESMREHDDGALGRVRVGREGHVGGAHRGDELPRLEVARNRVDAGAGLRTGAEHRELPARRRPSRASSSTSLGPLVPTMHDAEVAAPTRVGTLRELSGRGPRVCHSIPIGTGNGRTATSFLSHSLPDPGRRHARCVRPRRRRRARCGRAPSWCRRATCAAGRRGRRRSIAAPTARAALYTGRSSGGMT